MNDDQEIDVDDEEMSFVSGSPPSLPGIDAMKEIELLLATLFKKPISKNGKVSY